MIPSMQSWDFCQSLIRTRIPTAFLAQDSMPDQVAHGRDSESVPALAINHLAHLEDNCNQLPTSIDTAVQPTLGTTRAEQNPSVSCLRHLFSAFLMRTQSSSSGLFTNSQNLLITGGTFQVVSLFHNLCR